MDDLHQSEIDLRDIRVLIERIRRGNCVLVLGPRVAVRADDPSHTPLDELLARKLLLESEAAVEDVTSSPNLRRAAEIYYGKRKDRDELELVVSDFYKQNGSTPTDLHRDLAALPFRLCVSASPDDLMFAAFAARTDKSPTKSHYDFRATLAPRLASPTNREPLVYHLYGHCDVPSSLVLTESDLIEFLVGVIRGTPPVADQVRSLLANPSVSFLFLGFGFHHWYLRVLLHVMNIYGHRSKAIAFEDERFFDHPEREQTVSFFSGDRLIDFRPLRWEGFARQLREVYEATAPTGEKPPARPAAPSGEVPKVFLSYAGEDRPEIEALAARLESSGIDIWQDKQDLRAGDTWRRVLLDVIGHRVHYVVVVQTTTMVARDEGVFHQEIEAALQRQSAMRAPLRFVIPVKLGADCPVLPTLNHLHVIDVSTPEGIEALLQSIQEDWQQRRTRDVRPAVSA